MTLKLRKLNFIHFQPVMSLNFNSISSFPLDRLRRSSSSSAKDRCAPCLICGSVFHNVRNCPEANTMFTSQEEHQNIIGVKCFNCGMTGHTSKNCPNIEKGRRCYNCGEYGHIANDCPKPSSRYIVDRNKV